jgi:hypothetical protein
MRSQLGVNYLLETIRMLNRMVAEDAEIIEDLARKHHFKENDGNFIS